MTDGTCSVMQMFWRPSWRVRESALYSSDLRLPSPDLARFLLPTFYFLLCLLRGGFGFAF